MNVLPRRLSVGVIMRTPIAQHVKARRSPLWTLNDLAHEFGLSRGSLKNLMFSSPVAAPPVIAQTQAGYVYELTAMRRWWKDHKEAVDAKKPAVT